MVYTGMYSDMQSVVFTVVLIAGILVFLTFAFISIQKATKMAMVDPYEKNYKPKTDKELYSFVASSCVVAFLFAVISFHILLYIALLYWFYFIVYMLMFSRVWKFHGKKRIILYAMLMITIVVSFIAAPFAREAILKLLNYLNILI